MIEHDPLGSMPIQKINESELRLWASRQQLSPQTLRKRLGFVHQILRLHGNPARYKPPKSERHLRRPLSPEEAGKIIAAALTAEPTIRLGILLCLQCGLRLSEAVGLRHEDREGDGIRIKRSVVRVTGELRVRARPKTAKSAGWIPLPPMLLSEIGNGKGYVLGAGQRPIVPDYLTNHLKKIALKVGVVNVPHFGPHALRRTYGMQLLEAGVDPVTAADLMRHDVVMLLAEYSRTRVDLKIAAVSKAFPSAKPHELHHGRVKGT